MGGALTGGGGGCQSSARCRVGEAADWAKSCASITSLHQYWVVLARVGGMKHAWAASLPPSLVVPLCYTACTSSGDVRQPVPFHPNECTAHQSAPSAAPARIAKGEAENAVTAHTTHYSAPQHPERRGPEIRPEPESRRRRRLSSGSPCNATSPFTPPRYQWEATTISRPQPGPAAPRAEARWQGAAATRTRTRAFGPTARTSRTPRECVQNRYPNAESHESACATKATKRKCTKTPKGEQNSPLQPTVLPRPR